VLHYSLGVLPNRDGFAVVQLLQGKSTSGSTSMEANSQVQQVFVESPTESQEATAHSGSQRSESDQARSEKNIAEWMSYLPTSCVNSMIAMGWDIST
jgi:hypothetical protein